MLHKMHGQSDKHIVMAAISGGGEAQVAPPARGLGFIASRTRQRFAKQF